MQTLPVEIVARRLNNFWEHLKAEPCRSGEEPTEDLKAAADYVAKTSGFDSTAEMWKALFTSTTN